jgi:creatinine amidohydrolase
MQLADMNWPSLAALGKDTPIVFPLAALEQHGKHLPLFTDSLLLGEIIRRLAERFQDRAVFAPLLWLGNSDHHLDFPGTLSTPPRTYLDVLGGLLENFIQHGFRRLVFINGHGGNDVPGRQAVFEVRQRHRQRSDLLLLFATYWQLGARPWETEPRLQQRQMGHACEWETSMLLRLAPALVGMLDKLEPVPFGNGFAPATPGWITKDLTVSGHLGDPRCATAEKGEALFRVFTEDVAGLLDRVLRWDGKAWNS